MLVRGDRFAYFTERIFACLFLDLPKIRAFLISICDSVGRNCGIPNSRAAHPPHLTTLGRCSPPSEECGAIPGGAGGRARALGVPEALPPGQETCSLQPEVPSLTQASSPVQVTEDCHLFPQITEMQTLALSLSSFMVTQRSVSACWSPWSGCRGEAGGPCEPGAQVSFFLAGGGGPRLAASLWPPQAGPWLLLHRGTQASLHRLPGEGR